MSDTITVQDTVNTPIEATSSVESTLFSLVPFLLIFTVFYFLVIRPQDKKRKEQEDMIAGVKKGERVLTNSGIFGIVRDIDEKENILSLEVSEGVNIKITKSSVNNILDRKDNALDRKDDKKSKSSSSSKSTNSKKKAKN